MPIFITYEILRREKPFIIELLSVLKINFNDCIFIHQQTLVNILSFIKPSIIIFKSADFGRIAWYKKAKKAGHICYCYESEGLFVHPQDYANVRVCCENLDLLENYFLCGKYQESLLKIKYPKHINKFKVVGSPSIDFLKKNRIFYKSNTQKKYKIGILTGFGAYNQRGSRSYIDICKSIDGDQLSKKRTNELNELYLVSKRGFIEFQKITKLVCRNFIQTDILIRVHPSESLEPWLKLANNFPNLKIDSSDSIFAFLKKCSKVVSFKSTVALESLAVNKPIISYSPEFIDPKNIFYPKNEPENLSLKVNSEKKLLNYLDPKNKLELELLNRKEVFNCAENICFGFSNPSYASSKIICDLIQKNINSQKNKKYKKISNAYKVYLYTLSMVSHFLIIIKKPFNYIYYGKSKYGKRLELIKLNNEIENCSLKSNFVTFFSRIIIF